MDPDRFRNPPPHQPDDLEQENRRNNGGDDGEKAGPDKAQRYSQGERENSQTWILSLSRAGRAGF